MFLNFMARARLKIIALFGWLALAVTMLAAPVPPMPLSASANHRYLVDASGQPFLLIADSAWSLPANLNMTDAATFLHSRATNGFNAVMFGAVVSAYIGGSSSLTAQDGTPAFTGTANGQFDMATVNPAYFIEVSNLVYMCQTNGLIAIMDPLETGALVPMAQANGQAKCLAYGQWLGTFFGGFTNIIWMSGNDYGYNDPNIAAMDSVMTNIAYGIKTTVPNQIQSIETAWEPPANWSSGYEDNNWHPLISYAQAYAFSPTYQPVYAGYSSNALPVVLGEGHYEDESVGSNPTNTDDGTPLVLRKQEWWTITAGGKGQFYGNHYTWTFTSGWQGQLVTEATTELNYWRQFCASNSWWTWAPDTSHSVVTAGYGSPSDVGLVSTNDYVTTASNPNGTMVVAYLPNNDTITVNLAQMAGTVTAQWYDPTANSYSPVSGSPFANTSTHNFTPPGNNSQGSPDWVLLLTAATGPLQIVTSSLPQGTVGMNYSGQLLALGGWPPYYWSLSLASPPLPPNLSLSTAGLLSGVPATGGNFNLIAQIADSSNVVAAQSLSLTIASPDTTPPTVPAGLSAVTNGSSQINLSWVASTDNVGVAGYLVQRSQGTGSANYSQIATPAGTNYSDTGLAAGTVYNYRVAATDAAGNVSGYSGVASATTPASVSTPTPNVAWYKFSEGSGTAFADSTANADNGSLVGTPTWTTLNGASAISLNGTSQYGKAADIVSNRLSGSWTISCWIYPTTFPSSGGDGFVVEKIDSGNAVNYAIVLVNSSGTTFIAPYYDNGTTAPSDFPTYNLSLNTAYNVVAVWDSAARKCSLYINGSLIGTSGTETVLPKAGTGGQLNIGVDGYSYKGGYFGGKASDVRVFGRVLSGAQVSTIYVNGPGSVSVSDTTPPTVPAGLSAVTNGSSQINLSWVASTDNVGVAGYLVQRSQGTGSANYSQIATPAGTNYSDTGLAAGTVYNYRVAATDAVGNVSGYSSVASATTPAAADTTPPTVPAGLKANAVSSSQINLSWVASTDNVGVAGYLVQRSQGTGSANYSQIATPAGTNYSDTGLAAGTVYNYRVAATDAAGNVSGYSSVASATTPAAPDTTPPTVPAGLSAVTNGSSQINLSWVASTDNVGVAGYLVQRSQGTGSANYSQIATPAGTNYSDTGLAAGTVYNYRVAATDAAGNVSGYSSVASATTPAAPDTTPPTVPAGLSAVTNGSSQINLSWVASTDNVGVAGYLVQRSQGTGSANYSQIATPAGTNYSDTGLAAGTVYNYRVAATDAAGNVSGYSSVASATTPASVSTPTPNVAWYKFSEGSGTAFADSTANADNGSLVGTPTWTTLNGASAISLNGTSQYGKAADIVSNRLSGSWTISCWIYPTTFPSSGGDGFVVEKIDSGNAVNYAIVLVNSSGTTFIAPYYDNGTTAPSDFPTYNLSLNTAYNVVAVWDSAARKCSLYINGSLIGTSGTETVLPKAGTGGQLNIGVDGYSYKGGYFGGKASDVRVFGRVLSGAQVSTIYVNGPGSVSVSDTTPPTVPAGLSAVTNGSSQINLSWVASTDNVGVAGYLVQRSQGTGSANYSQIATPAGTNYSDTGLAAGTVYNYRVAATDAAGNVSGYSSVASATTPAAADTTPPTVPAGLKANAVSSSQINLSWVASTDNVGVAGYLVERRKGSFGSFVQVGTPAGTTFSDTGLSSRTSYSYRVRATDAAGNLSGYSSVATATTTH